MTRAKAVEIANDKLWMLFSGGPAAFVDLLIALDVLKVEPEPVAEETAQGLANEVA